MSKRPSKPRADQSKQDSRFSDGAKSADDYCPVTGPDGKPLKRVTKPAK